MVPLVPGINKSRGVGFDILASNVAMDGSQELSDSDLLRACDMSDADLRDMSDADLWDMDHTELSDADLLRECDRAEMEYHLGVTDEQLLQVSVCVCVCVRVCWGIPPGTRTDRSSIVRGHDLAQTRVYA